MKKRNVLLIVCFLALPFAFSSCPKSAAENTKSDSQLLSATLPTPDLSLTPTPNTDSAIKKIDFNNFTYTGPDDYAETFTLKNGEKAFKMGKEDGIYLFRTEYADLTGDSNEEAILTMSIQTGGSSSPNLIYIYTLENNKTKLLWCFMTGDRASGGLKKIYAANNELIVETFGDNKFINGEWKFDYPKGEFKGDCCPIAYTKIRFKWNGKKFIVQGKPELFDYDRNKDTNGA